jgi:hypothetical protein
MQQVFGKAREKYPEKLCYLFVSLSLSLSRRRIY